MPAVKKQQLVVAVAPQRAVAPYKRKYFAGKGAYKQKTAKKPKGNAYYAKKLGSGLVSYGVDKLANFFGNLLGSGDYQMPSYKVKNNVLMNLQDQIPAMHNVGENFVTIRHREYLGDIVSSSSAGAFKIDTFNLNAGDLKCFPWLSQVCTSSFQKWRPKGMVFEFRTMSADALNSTNTALGSVVMATNYDSNEVAFLNKAQMENTEFSCSCKPSMSMMHPIECAPRQNVLRDMYIRTGAESSATYDQRFDDLGKFYIATQGLQGTSVNVGELWVSYDIDIIQPVQVRALSNERITRMAIDYSNVTTSALTGTSTLIVGPGYTTGLNAGGVNSGANKWNLINNLGCTFSGNVITIPRLSLVPGQSYMVYYCARGAATASVAAVSLTYSSGLTNQTGLRNFTNYNNWPVSASTTDSCGAIGNFRVEAVITADQTITLACATLPGTLNSVDIIVAQISSVSLE